MRRPSMGTLYHPRRTGILPGRDVRRVYPSSSGQVFQTILESSSRSLWNDAREFLVKLPVQYVALSRSAIAFIPCKDLQRPNANLGRQINSAEPSLGIRVFESRDRVVKYDVGLTRFQKVVRRLGKGEIVRRRQGTHGVAQCAVVLPGFTLRVAESAGNRR